MKHHLYFGLLSTAASLLSLNAQTVAKKTSPNVILIITDDQGYGDLSCHGNPILKTPNLDRLHSESVRLTNFHVSPTCAPTRASLMTGRYNNATGVWHTVMGRELLRQNEVTMADFFSANNYKSGIFGKWHLGDNYPFRPQDRGFSHSFVHKGGGVGQTPDFWGNDYFDDTYFRDGIPEKQEGYCTDIWFKEAMKFIDNNKEAPFFAYISTNAPHSPFFVNSSYSAPYENNPKVPIPAFYGMIANIDENVGKLMTYLKENNLAKNTILIFMTDNGTAGGYRGRKGYNAKMRGIKNSPYEGGHRVPFFIRYPEGFSGSRDIPNLTAHIDILPTLTELCNLTPIKGPELHGKSLVPLLNQKSEAWEPRTIVVDSQRINHPAKWRSFAVMTDRWRLVNKNELYDIKKDPSQRKNIAKAFPKVVKKLKKEYDLWWKSTSSRFKEEAPIIVGSDAEPVTTLTSHDWRSDDCLKSWNQPHIFEAKPQINGHWIVDVEKAGNYEVKVMRWPAEAKTAINGQFRNNGRNINAAKAKLTINEKVQERVVHGGETAISFNVILTKGETKIKAEFIDKARKNIGAFYIQIKRILR